MNHIAFVSISFQKRRGKQNEERSLLGVGDHSDHPRTSKHRATSSEEVMGNDLESKFSFGSHVTRIDAILPRKGPITRTMSKRLQEDWARAAEEGPRVLMNLRVDF